MTFVEPAAGQPDVRPDVESGFDRGLALDGIEQQVARLVRRVRRVIRDRAEHVHPDLQPAAYLALVLLHEQGPMRPSAIAEAFEIDKGPISRQVQHLVDLGLATRSADPDDGRAMIVAVSAEAERRLASLAVVRRARLQERLGEWSDEELHGFVADLARYNASLEAPAQ